jgi:hypothetical protein
MTIERNWVMIRIGHRPGPLIPNTILTISFRIVKDYKNQDFSLIVGGPSNPGSALHYTGLSFKIKTLKTLKYNVKFIMNVTIFKSL